MGRIGTKMPNFCLNKIKPLIRVRSQSNDANSTSTDQERKDGFSGGGGKKPGPKGGRRVMIVVDSTIEAKNAVQWALSHTVQNHDVVILLYVTKPSKQGEQSSIRNVGNSRIPEFLICIKGMCQVKRPEVRVEVAVVEGREKGPTIVAEAKRREAALLVVGQKKRSVTWRLMLIWAGNRAVTGGMAEYCIQNASCMAIAVRRKSKKVGGYLITTKRQKDFWLLA